MKNLLLTTAVALLSLGGYAAEGDAPLIYEDFSKFTAGTQQQADETNVGTTEDDAYGRGSIDNFTLTPGWTAYGLYQAGGTGVLKGIDMYGSQYCAISSPSVAMDGNVRVRVKARLYPESSAATDMRMMLMSGYKYSDMQTVNVTSDWQEFTLDTKVAAGDWQVRLDVGDETGNVSPVQLALIEVTKGQAVTEKPAAPRALEPTRVSDTGFTAWWERVRGVSDYKVYVTYQENGQTRQFGDPMEVTLKSQWSDPAQKVTGLDPDVIYSYYVTAVNEGLESDPSNVVEVLSLSIPDVGMASAAADGSFTASWSKVHKATGYEVNLYRLSSAGRELVKTVSTDALSYEFKDLDASESIYWAYDVAALLDRGDAQVKSNPSDFRGFIFNADKLHYQEALSEDFSKFAKGSADNIFYRESDETDTWGEYVNNFNSGEIPAEYTAVPGWKGIGVAEAGGMAAVSYIPYPDSYSGGYIMTPEIAGQAVIKVKFRAAPIPQYFTVSDENPMKLPFIMSRSDYNAVDMEIISSSMPLITQVSYYKDEYGDGEVEVTRNHTYEVKDADWHEYELVFMSHSDKPIKFNIGSNVDSSTPFFIDDVKVEIARTSIEAPKAWDADNFTKDGFTAYWSEVPDAESYLVSVFRRKAGKEDYAIVDKEFTGTEGVITGLDPWSDWLFTVKAKLGAVVSEPSAPLAAMGVSVPETKSASEATADGFTANWERTPKATRYDLVIYRMEGETPVELKKVEIEEGETVSYMVDGLAKETVRDFGYALKAYYDTAADTYESAFSPIYAFNLDTLDADAIPAARYDVKAVNSTIVIEACAGTGVTVCDMTGRVLYRGAMTADRLVLEPAADSIYIVRIGGDICKIAL